MPSLADLLVDTQLFQAAQQGGTSPVSGLSPSLLSVSEARDSNRYEDAICPGPFAALHHGLVYNPVVFPAATIALYWLQTMTIEQNPIWSWKHDLARPALFTDLAVYCRDVQHDLMVCEELEFADVGVTLPNGEAVELPLTRDFVLERHHLKQGELTFSGHELWPLAANTDHSLQLVFGYSLEDEGPAPIDPALTTQSDFFPDLNASEEHVVATGESLALEVRPPRVIVALTLMCHKERADWEPLGILGAGRIYPTIMITADVDLEETRGRLRYKRPSMSSHCEGEEESGCHSDPHPEMPAELSTILVADTNQKIMEAILEKYGEAHAELERRTGMDWGTPIGSGMDVPIPEPPPPFWPFVFDYVDLDPFASEFDTPRSPFAVTDASAFATKRPKPTCTQFRCVYPHEAGASDPPPLVDSIERNYRGLDYFLGDVHKVVGQGEFDNIHVAPDMSAVSLVQQLTWPTPSPGLTKQEYIDRTFVSSIKMAPVCMHDCFHLHWRWGKGVFMGLPADRGNRWVSGWDDSYDPAQPWSPGKPFAKAGAPLIPRNQSLTCELHTPTEFSLSAAAHPFEVEGERKRIPARSWSVLHHHGASIGLALAMYLQRTTTNLIEAMVQGVIPIPDPIWGGTAEGPIPNLTRSWGIEADTFFLPEPNPALPYASGTGNMRGGSYNDFPHWSIFYWHLRFGGQDGPMTVNPGYADVANKANDIICERLQIPEHVSLLDLRQHGIPTEYR